MICTNAYVWVWDGPVAWHFATIKKPIADKIKKGYSGPRKGFGSIPVNVQVGKTKWKTSIFPEKDGSYLLPLKKEVRKREDILAGKNINVKITLHKGGDLF